MIPHSFKLTNSGTKDKMGQIETVIHCWLTKEGQKSTPNLTKTRSLPTRDEIQEFSFQLRDDLKVTVQAEVPYGWQSELEEIARHLRVKKLELYRFIIGEFLGKIKQNPDISR